MSLGGPSMDDVDELVERINHLNSPDHIIDPKKAAKKARQKLRKQAEKKQELEDAERELRERQERQRALEPRIDEAVAGLQYLALTQNKGRFKDDKENTKQQHLLPTNKQQKRKGQKLSTSSGSKKDASRLTKEHDSKVHELNNIKEPVKITVEFLQPDEPSDSTTRNRRRFVIKDLNTMLKDPSQLVDILQRRKTQACSSNDKKGNYSDAIELEISDSESDDVSPPRVPSTPKVFNQPKQPSTSLSSVNKKSKKKNKEGNNNNSNSNDNKNINVPKIVNRSSITSITHPQTHLSPINQSCKNSNMNSNAKNTAATTTTSTTATSTNSNSSSKKKKKKKNPGKTDESKTDSSFATTRTTTTSKKESVQIQSKLQEVLHADNNHLSWNRLTGEETSSSESKAKQPEMVTIRRHPTVSDTTVTISIKNPNGNEDILYTLLNGQVVRTKPDSMDIDSFIADENSKSTSTTTTTNTENKSSKKRRRKKNKKEATQSQSQSSSIIVDPQDIGKRSNYNIVTFTPEPIVQNGASKTESYHQNQQQQQQLPPPVNTGSAGFHSSFFSELQDDVEIDLTKIKLPPGITITKIQPPNTDIGDKPQYSNDEIEIESSNGTYGEQHQFGQQQQQQQSSNGPQIYYSDGFHSKSNVIVVDSQEYNVDNESDVDDYVGFKKRPNKFEEVVSSKMKKLRNRVNKYLYGDEPSEHQERVSDKIITPAQANMYLNQHINRSGVSGGEHQQEPCVHIKNMSSATQTCRSNLENLSSSSSSSSSGIIGEGMNRSFNFSSSSVKCNSMLSNNNNNTNNHSTCQFTQGERIPSINTNIYYNNSSSSNNNNFMDNNMTNHQSTHFNIEHSLSQCPQQQQQQQHQTMYSTSDFGNQHYHHHHSNMQQQQQVYGNDMMMCPPPAFRQAHLCRDDFYSAGHSNHTCQMMMPSDHHNQTMEFSTTKQQQQQYNGSGNNDNNSSAESYSGAQNFTNSRLHHVHTPLFSVNSVDML